VAHETLALKFGKCRNLLSDRAFSRRVDLAHDSQVDDVERVDAEVAKVVVDASFDVFRLGRRYPRGVFTTNSADLGDDHKVIRVRVERFANDLVSDVRPVEVARIDVIDSRCDRFAKDGDGGAPVLSALAG
jgi:hypothetical protein